MTRFAPALIVLLPMVLAACETEAPSTKPSPPVATIPPAPMERYQCGPYRVDVRLLGANAEVAVDGAAPVALPVLGNEGTTYSNGRLTLTIVQGRTSFAVGRMASQPCEAVG